MALSIIDRLNDKTVKDLITGCWLWQGSNDGRKGYGKIRFNFVKVAVHRVSAHLFLDLDLKNPKLQALHKHDICPNKNCWNPEHLYVGTAEDNSRDNVLSGVLLKRKTQKIFQNLYCKKNLHEMSELNTGIDHRKRRYCIACYKISHRYNSYE